MENSGISDVISSLISMCPLYIPAITQSQICFSAIPSGRNQGISHTRHTTARFVIAYLVPIAAVIHKRRQCVISALTPVAHISNLTYDLHLDGHQLWITIWIQENSHILAGFLVYFPNAITNQRMEGISARVHLHLRPLYLSSTPSGIS